MKKYVWIFLIILIMGLIFFVFYQKNIKSIPNGPIATKLGTETKMMGNSTTHQVTTEELSDFSTKLPKDTKERYSNIKLACQTLNGTIIKAGETFSLWNALGCPTKEKGYRKAKTFTSHGGVTKSYAGGICQVSTTIYNAALEVKELEIIERHEHSRDVVYIEDGKDAAVSYKTADLKFKNTLNYDVQLQAKLEDNQVKISLMRI